MVHVTKSRLIVLLTPIFTIASAALAAWVVKTPLGKWLDLLHVNQDTIIAAMILGGGAALTAAIKFLHGNVFWEKYAAGLIDVQDDSLPPPGA